jgi:hypothetical protein
MTSPDIGVYARDGITTLERHDLDGIRVASFHRQGNWRLRCYISPDEYAASEWATREACEHAAIHWAATFDQPDPPPNYAHPDPDAGWEHLAARREQDAALDAQAEQRAAECAASTEAHLLDLLAARDALDDTEGRP